MTLLSEGQTRKYLKYAVGEILLVVVGILIALQVNNWNQQRKEHILEEKILLEIENNLSDDIVDLDDEIASFQVVIESDSVLIDHFRSGLPFHDSIGALLHISQMSPHFTVGKNGYKLLESKGIELISNDSLRIEITDLYERNYPYYATYAQERFTTIESIIHPFWVEHFSLERHDTWPYYKRVPKDYSSLLADDQIISLVQAGLLHAIIMKRNAVALKKDIETLQDEIRAYLRDR